MEHNQNSEVPNLFGLDTSPQIAYFRVHIIQLLTNSAAKYPTIRSMMALKILQCGSAVKEQNINTYTLHQQTLHSSLLICFKLNAMLNKTKKKRVNFIE